MGTPNLFGITAIKQETEGEYSDGHKDVSGSKHSTFSIEHEANVFAISSGTSPDCTANSNHLEQELNNDGDKGSFDKDVSKQGYGTSNMPGLTNICLKQEMNVDGLENELPSNIYVFAKNDRIKQEVSCTGERYFKCDIFEKIFLRKSCLYTHLRTHFDEKPSNVICVRNVLLQDPVYSDIKQLIMEKRFGLFRHQTTYRGFKYHLLNVAYVKKHSAKNPIYLSTKELIVEHLSNVVFVRNVIQLVPVYLVTKDLASVKLSIRT